MKEHRNRLIDALWEGRELYHGEIGSVFLENGSLFTFDEEKKERPLTAAGAARVWRHICMLPERLAIVPQTKRVWVNVYKDKDDPGRPLVSPFWSSREEADKAAGFGRAGCLSGEIEIDEKK